MAEVKAVLLSAIPTAQLVDITHDVPPGDVPAAQYLLGRAWHRFPAGTVHLAVVDPGVGTARRAIVAGRDGHGFVAPDNGLLTPVLDGARVIELAVPPSASPTFHARDVFAPAAARLAIEGTPEGLGIVSANPPESPMPVTAKLSKLADEIVNWFNQVDATYRADLRELNELNFARFDAKLEQRVTELRAELTARIDRLEVTLERRLAEQTRWLFGAWAALLIPIIGLWLRK